MPSSMFSSSINAGQATGTTFHSLLRFSSFLASQGRVGCSRLNLYFSCTIFAIRLVIGLFTTRNICFHPSVGGASFADIGEALDEIVSLSMTDDDEGSEKMYSVDIHKDMVISCCWLNIKVLHSLVPFFCVSQAL